MDRVEFQPPWNERWLRMFLSCPEPLPEPERQRLMEALLQHLDEEVATVQ